MAQPRPTSSTCTPGRWGAWARASLITSAARSSGRTARRRPFGALPTGVRTAATMKASFMVLVPQWFAGLERVLDALDGLRLAAQAQKDFAFQFKDVLLG